MPRVSVIVPVYGVEKYIERCAHSLFGQTLDDIEYLFIDDCSPDKSIEILEQIIEEYPNRKSQVIIHRMEENSGQAKVREWGMKNATGDYVIHCDSDDWVDFKMYEILYNKAVEESADVVVCGYMKHDGNVCLSKRNGMTKSCNDLDTTIWDCVQDKTSWALWNKLIKRSLYSEDIVYPNENMGEDMCLTLQIFSKQPQISYVDQFLYYYYVNPDSIMNTVTKESTIRNYYQLKSNVASLVSALNKNGTYQRNRKYVEYLYYRTSNILLPFISDNDVFRIWRIHFEKKISSVFLSGHISFPRKIRHLFILFRLYK